MVFRHSLARALIYLTLLPVAVSCSSFSPVALEPDIANNLVWPSPPASARLTFVRSISRPADLGFSKGFFARLVEVIFGEEQEQLVRPISVIDANKILYVGDPGAGGVHEFDRTAGRYRLIRTEGGNRLPSPVGLAIGENGAVYVADSALGAVFVIKSTEKYALRLPITQALTQPTGIAFDAVARELYVADTSSHCIKIFTADGRYLRTLGRRGSGDGEFNFPTMLWRSASGQLMVTDSLNFRTQIFDLDGRYLGKFGQLGDGIGDTPRQKGLATDRFGHIYVVDSLLSAVQIFDETGQLLLAIGNLGQSPGEFWLPTGIFVGSDDLIYVADTYNRRLQVFRYVGGPT
jgi:DNA-binding beta-propeller fold protein YncE